MRMRHIATSLAVAGLAATVTVHAQESREDKFRAWDANRDGRLEMGEMQANQANFRSMDCNRDGYLTHDEFMNRYQCDGSAATAPVAQPAPVADAYGRLDRNGDGYLSQAEWTTGADDFRLYDRNNDGRVGRDEYGNPVAANTPEGRFQIEDLNNDGMIARGEWRADRVAFDRLDRDNDGVVRWDEYQNPRPAGAMDTRFDGLDRNNDGVIARGEWQGDRGQYDRMDRNNDGVVTWTEYSSVPGENNVAGNFDELDRNNDGVISRFEWRGESTQFGTADRDNDNVVTRAEYAAMSGGYGGSGDAVAERMFRNLDRNNNGTLSEGEWRGEKSAFRIADRNRDKRLTRDEYLTLYTGTGSTATRDQRFRELDRNNDGILTSYEWRGESVGFNAVDRDNDRAVTRSEYFAMGTGNDPYRRVSYDPREERFASEDRNRDSRIARSEWQGERGAFDVFDRNRDGYISSAEYRDRSALTDQFTSWDSNRDGRLTREEFRYGQALYDRLDTNNDRYISREEYLLM